MSIRFNAASGGSLATLLATDIFPVMRVSNTTDYYITGTVLSTYIGTGLTMTGTLACGANTLSGSAIAFTGGTIGNITLGITGGAITNCQIDNININGNTISSTDTNGNIVITPNGTGVIDIAAGDLDYGGTAITATGLELNITDASQDEAVFKNGSTVAFRVSGANQVFVTDGAFIPGADDDIDLGSAIVQFKNGYFDGTLEADVLTRNGFTVTDIDHSVGVNTISVSQAAAYTAAGAGYYEIDTSSNDVAFYCPSMSSAIAGQEIIVYHTTAGNTLRIRSDGADAGFVLCTGDDAETTGTLITMTTADDFVMLKCSGGHGGVWAIIGGSGVDLS